MNYLKENNKIFSKLGKDFKNIIPIEEEAFFYAKNGELSARISGKIIHSAYDPSAEAKKLVEAYEIDDSPIIVLGFGLGYHVKYILEKNPGRRLLIVERNLPLMKKVLEKIDFSTLNGDFKFYTSDNPDKIISDYEFYNALKNKPTIIVHKPSTLAFIKFYQNLTDLMLSANRFTAGSRFKVSLISPIMGGSLLIADYVRKSLLDLGVEVDYIDNSIHLNDYNKINKRSKTEQVKAKNIFFRHLTDTIESRITDFNSDLVLGIAQAPISIRLLNNLGKKNIRTAFWFVENFRQLTYWKYMAPYYDYFFTIQEGEFFEVLQRIGVRNYYYLPMGFYKGNFNSNLVTNYKYDVSMVTACYENRQKFVENVLKIENSLPISIFGNGWSESSIAYSCVKQGNWLNEEEMHDIYRQSKIVLNLHSSTSTSSAMPEFDKDYINPRTFELAAMGVFQLVDHRDALEEFFEIGKEIITFKSESDFIEKVRYYLKNELERKEIALRARTRALRDHSYSNRIISLVTRIFGLGVLNTMGNLNSKEKGSENNVKSDNKIQAPVDTFNKDIAVENLGIELLKEQKDLF